MTRRLLFPVEVVAEDSGRVYVGGRVCGDLIRLGDCFTAAVTSPAREQGVADHDVRSVSLLVRGILLYRKYLNQVHSGMTAELEVALLAGEKPIVGETLVGEALGPAFAVSEVLGSGEFHVQPV